MKAKFVNEIVKGMSGSGWGAVGVGTATVTKFYDKLLQNWPDTAYRLFSLSHNSSYYISAMADKAAKILNCDPNKIKYMQKQGFGSDKLLDRWVETLIELSHIEPIVLDGEEYRNYDESYVKSTIKIFPIPEWQLVVIEKESFYADPVTQVNYLIKTPPTR